MNSFTENNYAFINKSYVENSMIDNHDMLILYVEFHLLKRNFQSYGLRRKQFEEDLLKEK